MSRLRDMSHINEYSSLLKCINSSGASSQAFGPEEGSELEDGELKLPRSGQGLILRALKSVSLLSGHLFSPGGKMASVAVDPQPV